MKGLGKRFHCDSFPCSPHLVSRFSLFSENENIDLIRSSGIYLEAFLLGKTYTRGHCCCLYDGLRWISLCRLSTDDRLFCAVREAESEAFELRGFVCVDPRPHHRRRGQKYYGGQVKPTKILPIFSVRPTTMSGHSISMSKHAKWLA